MSALKSCQFYYGRLVKADSMPGTELGILSPIVFEEIKSQTPELICAGSFCPGAKLSLHSFTVQSRDQKTAWRRLKEA